MRRAVGHCRGGRALYRGEDVQGQVGNMSGMRRDGGGTVLRDIQGVLCIGRYRA